MGVYPSGWQPIGVFGKWFWRSIRAAAAAWQAKIKSKAIANTFKVVWVMAFVQRYAIGVYKCEIAKGECGRIEKDEKGLNRKLMTACKFRRKNITITPTKGTESGLKHSY